MKPGDVLGFGATAADAFDVKRTMSDDGERLTKLNVEGALTIEGETWTVSGYLRQPGGRAPKDTFELTFRKDDKNVVELVLQRAASGQDRAERPEGPDERRHDAQGQRQAGGLFGLYDAQGEPEKRLDGGRGNAEREDHRFRQHDAEGQPAGQKHAGAEPDRRGGEKRDPRDDRGSDGGRALTVTLTGKLMLNENTFLQGGASMRVTIGGEASDGASERTATR
ncbi:MAG: hypothetical protein ACLUHE_06315 [Christensenellales bacterium]